MTISSTSHQDLDTFRTYLLHLLLNDGSDKEIGGYDGPRDWKTDAILEGLGRLVRKSQAKCNCVVDGSAVENGHGNEAKPALRVEYFLVGCRVFSLTDVQALPAWTNCPKCGRLPPPTTMEPVSFASTEEELIHLRSQREELESLREQVQELQLLKNQVQVVARVCNTVARGDLLARKSPSSSKA